eukprot:5915894-Ditylum_brightwellii.AAC.1
MGLEEYEGFYSANRNVIAAARLIPGQAFPVNIALDMKSICTKVISVNATISATFMDLTHWSNTNSVVSVYTYTFVDSDGSIQYSAAMPPAKPCPLAGCSLIFSTHGASVDASSPSWTGAYDQQENAWIVFATNSGKRGYNWQGVGRRNGLHTLHLFVSLLPGVPSAIREHYKADSSRVLYSGHSIG